MGALNAPDTSAPDNLPHKKRAREATAIADATIDIRQTRGTIIPASFLQASLLSLQFSHLVYQRRSAERRAAAIFAGNFFPSGKFCRSQEGICTGQFSSKSGRVILTRIGRAVDAFASPFFQSTRIRGVLRDIRCEVNE
jgi:hypothetical protein